MTTKFFSRVGPTGGATGPPHEELERQQAVVARLLGRDPGATVSFIELHDAGIEFPASVVSELELAGAPIERCSIDIDGARRPGVRLDPSRAFELAPAAAQDARGAAAQEAAVRLRAPALRLPGVPVSAIVAVLVSGALVLALVLLVLGAAGTGKTRVLDASRAPALASARSQSSAAHKAATPARAPGTDAHAPGSSDHPSAPMSATTRQTASTPATAPGSSRTSALGSPPAKSSPATATPQDGAPSSPQPRSSAPSSGVQPAGGGTAAPAARAGTPAAATGGAAATQPQGPVSVALAAQLQTRGHALLEAGAYTQAASLQSRALAATGESLQSCLQPAGEACLIYAYALYDLGRALALEGQPAAAVGVLQRRLLIDNQREAVAAELARVRAQAG
jgi:hypothetical protein